jgi:hypothetical protein
MNESMTYNTSLLEFVVVCMAAALIVGLILKTMWDNDRKGPR